MRPLLMTPIILSVYTCITTLYEYESCLAARLPCLGLCLCTVCGLKFLLCQSKQSSTLQIIAFEVLQTHFPLGIVDSNNSCRQIKIYSNTFLKLSNQDTRVYMRYVHAQVRNYKNVIILHSNDAIFLFLDSSIP